MTDGEQTWKYYFCAMRWDKDHVSTLSDNWFRLPKVITCVPRKDGDEEPSYFFCVEDKKLENDEDKLKFSDMMNTLEKRGLTLVYVEDKDGKEVDDLNTEWYNNPAPETQEDDKMEDDEGIKIEIEDDDDDDFFGEPVYNEKGLRIYKWPPGENFFFP